MAWNGWTAEMPVIVVGVENGRITENGLGAQEFASLADAKAVFPDLDPEKNTERFTWAGDGTKNGSPQIRFETWQAYERYSS